MVFNKDYSYRVRRSGHWKRLGVIAAQWLSSAIIALIMVWLIVGQAHAGYLWGTL